MLRDRYYIGEVRLKGEYYDGRHPAIIDLDFFNRVQEIMDARGRAGERRRIHDHYLKGTLCCGRCRKVDNKVRRMVVQKTTGRHGGHYSYFFCMGVQDGTCDAAYSNSDRVEEAVEEHYKTIAFKPEFAAAVRGAIEGALADQEAAQQLLCNQLADQLAALNAKEENLLDLGADGDLPQAKIRTRLREIGRTRDKLAADLGAVESNLRSAAEHIDAYLRLLTDPYETYTNADDALRRLLNQASSSESTF